MEKSCFRITDSVAFTCCWTYVHMYKDSTNSCTYIYVRNTIEQHQIKTEISERAYTIDLQFISPYINTYIHVYFVYFSLMPAYWQAPKTIVFFFFWKV